MRDGGTWRVLLFRHGFVVLLKYGKNSAIVR